MKILEEIKEITPEFWQKLIMMDAGRSGRIFIGGRRSGRKNIMQQLEGLEGHIFIATPSSEPRGRHFVRKLEHEDS